MALVINYLLLIIACDKYLKHSWPCDFYHQTGGPSYAVELGRLDGLSSKASDVEGNLPKPTFNLDQLNSMFASHGLSQTDMTALSGNAIELNIGGLIY